MVVLFNTIRKESAPYSVKMVTVVTGSISANTLSAGVKFRLQPTSPYVSIEKEITARAMSKDAVWTNSHSRSIIVRSWANDAASTLKTTLNASLLRKTLLLIVFTCI